MATAEEVKKLAALSRIEVPEAELKRFTQEFDAILAYVGQLDALEVPRGAEEVAPLRNVMREDGEPHAPGAFTEALAAQFPGREGDALVVKQVITHE
ncbi:MAG: Asp-tRNA(Asn)/Glu-tRNA(Gln) amidotransferase subunit GatC [bacterium]|nr:Asp-tRNA(Asn)/Glu-tRNA(Gln) amidotransferase subunit GatC [bacterium]